MAVVLLAAPIIRGELARTRTAPIPLAVSPAVRPAQRPDVYLLILDGYGREDVVHELYGFDNPLPARLRTAGFFVADHARANYAQTALSLASAFNLDYLPQLGKPERSQTETRRSLADLISGSRFLQAFADAGYDIRTYSSEYSLIRPGRGRTQRRPLFQLNDFAYTAFEATAVPVSFAALGLPRGWFPLWMHRHHLRWTLHDLAESILPEDAPPTVVLAHLLAPHPPFALDADGGIRNTRIPALLNDGSMWRTIAERSGESYKAGYVDTVQYLNDGISRVAQAIVNRPSRPAIVLIHSDHGPGLELDFESVAGTNMHERMSVLAAVRFPDAETPPFDDCVSLVNVYRTVINRALRTQLPMLNNRSYFSTWSKPFAFVDVTDRLDSTERQPSAALVEN
jgi:hypothetical protein